MPFTRTEVPENCLRKLVTNRGQQFRSRAFEGYLKQNDIKLYKTTPYYPWDTEEIKRLSSYFKRVDQCAQAKNKDWSVAKQVFIII